ncbi:MAG: class I SAM-dependent methyltransferase [Acidobacteriia bacterium]|nr:class I SAM-dependent methyltransferase [Terriglobia bacterium]
MPVSAFDNIDPMLSFIIDLQPRRILDVGVGHGKYGFLCREYLEVQPHRFSPSEWQSEIVGIEVWDKYRNPVWGYAYNQVVLGDARQLIGTLGTFDLVIFADIIEHFTKEDGMKLIQKALDISKWVIVSTPSVFVDEEDFYETQGNKQMRHLSLWSPKDFAPYHTIVRDRSQCFIALISKQPLDKSVGYVSSDWFNIKRMVRKMLPQWLVSGVHNMRAHGSEKTTPPH